MARRPVRRQAPAAPLRLCGAAALRYHPQVPVCPTPKPSAPATGGHALRGIVAALLGAAPVLGQPATPPASATTAPRPPTEAPPAEAPPARPALAVGEPRLQDFAPLPGDVAWPGVETTTDDSTVPAGGDIHYSVAIKGLAPLGLEDEYRALSTLWTKRNEETNIAQINRRITEDRDLIDQLLRSTGHYGGTTRVLITAPTRAGAPTTVALTVDPGPLYTFSAIEVTRPADAIGPDPAALVMPLLHIKPGDAVDAVRVTEAEDALAVKLANKGYAFPVIAKPDIVIDHATHSATLAQAIDLGPRGINGTIRIEGETQGFTPEHVAVLARFKPGSPYTEAGRDDLRRAMIQTGLFGGVVVKPVASGPINPDGTQTVDLLVTAEKAPVRTIAASGGYSTGQGIRVEASWANRNMVPPEGAFTVRAVGAEREQVLNFELRRHNWRRRDQTLILDAGLSAEEQNAFQAKTVSINAAIERVSNIIWQKPWTYSLGAEALVTQQRDRSAPNDPNNIYYIIAFPASATWDRSDNLLDPHKGFRLTGRVSPEFTLRSGTNFDYFKLQAEGTAYQEIGPIVFAERLHLGAIVGASRGRIAPDRRFYAGGGGSVRGYSYQAVGPTDSGGSPTGGNSLTEASFEARYRFHAFGSDLGIVGFTDAGQVYSSALPQFTNLKVGAGIGFRYYTSFGPIRFDLATPVTYQPGDPRVSFYVSIGQAF